MSDMNDRNRIIGDFLEINADIVYQQSVSKLPKFISNIISRYYRNKLIKRAKKLKTNHIVLSKGNLYELFSYLYNNFNDSYKSNGIDKITKSSEDDSLEAIIKIDKISSVIYIDPIKPKFNISILDKRDDLETKSYNLDRIIMDGTEESIHIINDKLVEIMVDYIINILLLYNKKHKE